MDNVYRPLLAGFLLLATPVASDAQLFPDEDHILSVSRARLSVTPFLGVRAPLVSNRRAAVVVTGRAHPTVVVFDAQQDGGGVAGLEAELRLVGPFAVAGALGFTNPDDMVTTIRSEGGVVTQTVLQGPSVWFARADLSYELPAPNPDVRPYRPAAYLMLGPALLREDYGDGILSLGNDDDTIDNWAMHVGIKALMPMGSRGAVLYLSFEDYATFWNPRDDDQQRLERLLSLEPGTVLSTGFDYNTTHVLMLNVGLALRL